MGLSGLSCGLQTASRVLTGVTPPVNAHDGDIFYRSPFKSFVIYNKFF